MVRRHHAWEIDEYPRNTQSSSIGERQNAFCHCRPCSADEFAITRDWGRDSALLYFALIFDCQRDLKP
jgi:hypothetical protein